MSKYSLKAQERENYCVCSVFQAIFQNEEIELSQDDIAARLTPQYDSLADVLKNNISSFVIDDEGIRYFMNSIGFEYSFFHHNETPFNEPDSLLEEMNNNHGFIGINGHGYLLENFDYPVLHLIDPETEEVIERNLFELFENAEKVKFGLVERLG